MGPLRVCIVVGYDLTEEGGVKRHAFHVASALRRLGDEVIVIGPSSASRLERPVGPHVHAFGGVINIPSNGSDNLLGLLTPPIAVHRFFRAHAFDVIHVHEPLLPALPYWAAWLTPRTAHVGTFHGYSEGESPGVRLLRRIAAPVLFPLYQRGIAVSEPAERFAKVVWKRSLAVIPNGVPTDIFTPRADREPPPQGQPLKLLFVGHWRDPRKGLPYLLDAMTRLHAAGVAVTLDVIGKGGARVDAPGVTYHGPISDERVLAEHYRACDVFVAPATGQESFGIVLLEAMASGRPIVCSDIEGYRQVVEERGARFVARKDGTALAHAIAGLARSPLQRTAMGLANRRRAETFSWTQLAARVRAEYTEAIDQRAR